MKRGFSKWEIENGKWKIVEQFCKTFHLFTSSAIHPILPRLGFTLAEVLIVMGIIGIIAEMTLPGVITNAIKTETVAQLKKAYSTLSGAYDLLIAENDDIISAFHPNGSTIYDMGTLFITKMNVVKNCGRSSYSSVTGCFPNLIYKALAGNGGYKNFSIDDSYTTCLTADGMAYAFYTNSNNCDSNQTRDNDSSSPIYNSCGSIAVDVNGPNKGPAQNGRDTFYFWITQKGVYPMGFTFDDLDIDYGQDDCVINSDNYGNHPGSSCAAKVLKEGAINY